MIEYSIIFLYTYLCTMYKNDYKLISYASSLFHHIIVTSYLLIYNTSIFERIGKIENFDIILPNEPNNQSIILFMIIYFAIDLVLSYLNKYYIFILHHICCIVALYIIYFCKEYNFLLYLIQLSEFTSIYSSLRYFITNEFYNNLISLFFCFIFIIIRTIILSYGWNYFFWKTNFTIELWIMSVFLLFGLTIFHAYWYVLIGNKVYKNIKQMIRN